MLFVIKADKQPVANDAYPNQILESGEPVSQRQSPSSFACRYELAIKAIRTRYFEQPL